MLGIILTAAGSLGIIGSLIALWIFSAVGREVIGSILRCRVCLITVAVVAALIGSNWLGYKRARTECQEAQLNARLAIQRADLEAAKKAERDANTRADEIEESASAQRKTDADYIASLKSRPACDLTDADIRGLPNHKHGNGARPAAGAR